MTIAPAPAAAHRTGRLHPLQELLNQPWAILPTKLVELRDIYAAHQVGGRVDLADLEARLGRPIANEQKAFEVRAGGVAVLSVEGVIAPKANLFTQVSGGASAQLVQQQLEAAIADSAVRSLILQIDSPGGSIFGAPELAARVFELSSRKPIVAVSDGVMASAAYWIGSAANAAYITGPTVHVGSIGVVATHVHAPGPAGSTTTEITAGKYKRMGSDTQPLDAEGRAYIQQRVDHVYGVFVDAVARNRGVDAETVLAQMADGRIFVGVQAINAGLVEGFASVDVIAERLAQDPSQFGKRKRAVIGAVAHAGLPLTLTASAHPPSPATRQVTAGRKLSPRHEAMASARAMADDVARRQADAIRAGHPISALEALDQIRQERDRAAR